MQEPEDAPSLTSISPLFIVSTLSAATAFYQERLDFQVQFQTPENKPFFAIVGRDGISIMLKEIGPDVRPHPNSTQHEWARWDAYIHAPDPDALFIEFQRRGISFHRELGEDEDGLLGFEIKDADGYVLFFGRLS